MKHIVVDLEMNPINRTHRKERGIVKSEIIEIGAVVYDEELNEVASYCSFVKPQYNETIEQNITELTGINTSKVTAAPYFSKAMDEFIDWCNQYDDYEIIAWSDNDERQIRKEAKLKKYTFEGTKERLFEKWRDYQAEFRSFLALENNMSLQCALEYAGATFDGHAHDAVWDARNTARLFAICQDEKSLPETLQKIRELLTPHRIVCTMGELIDFDALMLQVAN